MIIWINLVQDILESEIFITRGNFSVGSQSTSHIVGLWRHLKERIKKTYHIIPAKNIIIFIREVEYKYLIRNKNYEEKIRDFFECLKYITDVEDVEFEELFKLNNSDDSDDDD